MVSKIQWRPLWLATQLHPQNDSTGWQNRVNYDVFAHAPLFSPASMIAPYHSLLWRFIRRLGDLTDCAMPGQCIEYNGVALYQIVCDRRVWGHAFGIHVNDGRRQFCPHNKNEHGDPHFFSLNFKKMNQEGSGHLLKISKFNFFSLERFVVLNPF